MGIFQLGCTLLQLDEKSMKDEVLRGVLNTRTRESDIPYTQSMYRRGTCDVL
jgi:hypothetical protein